MRGRRTVFEDLIIIAGKLPWQAGLVLALFSFIGLHIIAVHFVSPIVVAGNVNFGAIYMTAHEPLYELCVMILLQ